MLLINPATHSFGGFLSRYVPVGIPVSIGMISSYLEANDIACRVHDEEIQKVTPNILKELTADLEKPLVFGVSCLTAHVARGYDIARMIKSNFPDSTVVLGGLHPTTLPEEALKTGCVDYVVRGEGEEVMLQLYRAIQGEGNPEEILGLSFIRDGKIVHNGEAPLIPDINDIPPFPYHLFDHPKYDMGFLSSSRGCPYRCSYCSQRLLTGTTYRYQSAERIVNDLETVLSYGQDSIVFYDDNFCLKPRRIEALCDLLVERNLHTKVKLSVQTRADNVVNQGGEDLVRQMAESGFVHMGFGVETGVQRLADLVKKDETVEIHLEASELCKKHGMDVSFFMIFGLPTETDEDRRQSFDVVQSAGLQATKFNNLIPYPGTPLWTELKDSGRVVKTRDWGNFDSVLAMTTSIFDKAPLPYVPETCSEWQLKRDIIRYNLKSYVNRKSIAAIFGHTKGIGWFMLPQKWYLKPRELYEMAKIGVHLVTNIIMTALPLKLSERIMVTLNPRLNERPRVRDYDPDSYKTVEWEKINVTRKRDMLRKARIQREKTGHFSVKVNEVGSEASSVSSLG
jgi:radical SAM superfamily enzyme YgiQ (UPF0313 family)|tara:strand:- start:46 stop:1746 length:1701 start_codon:yes stop_codon:yes gene_type:complete